VRKYQEYRDEARQISTELITSLVLAVLGTIVVSTLALAAVATIGPYIYLSATTSIEMPYEHWRSIFFARLWGAGLLTTGLIAGAALYKSFQLSEEGGRGVARSLGGKLVRSDTQDPQQRKLLNVVEELAIATGLRTPPVFVLEDEEGINAFAAGFETKDVVIGVTRGAVEHLKRNQLQGVIAHEFSHIVHGDMRLNIRLLGVVTGIQAISFVAAYLLRLGVNVKHPLGSAIAFAFGGVIWPIGQIGSLFALLVNFAVNRQREFLADASAVHFTRDPQGLCDALRILLEEEQGSRVRGSAARLASHMFFASSDSAWQRLFQTHPPLEERIRRIDPMLSSPSPPVGTEESVGDPTELATLNA
jgi:Zn-dependent protease with chaperone function